MPAPRSAGNAYSEFVKEARKRTRNEMGTQLESKATDEFCVAFGGAPPVEFAEAMAAPGSSRPPSSSWPPRGGGGGAGEPPAASIARPA